MAKVKITERTAMNAWLALSDTEQLQITAEYLGEAAAGRFVAHGRIKNHQYSLAELAQLRDAQPAFPPGQEPAGNWTTDELTAYIVVKDAEIAAMPRPKRQLRVDQLNDQQRHRVAQATSQAEVDRLLDAFTRERLGETVDDSEATK